MEKKPAEKKQVGTHIDADLYSRAKALAAIQKRNTGEVIDDALREYLSKHGFWPSNRIKPPMKNIEV